MEQKKYAQAVHEFSMALAFDDKFVNAYFARGQALEKTGQKQKAIADYRQAAKLDPELRDAKAALKRLGVKVPGAPK